MRHAHAGRLLARKDAVSLKELPVETRSLLIRHLVLQDARAVLELSNEETSRTWLPSQICRSHRHAVSILERLIGQYSTPANPRHGPYVLAIEHRTSGRLIGHVGFSPLDEDVEIGFAIAQGYQRQGLATEAIIAASRWAFQAFELDRILAITSAANVASKRALSRAQFAYEGDKMMNFQGIKQSVSVYALWQIWLWGAKRGRLAASR